MNFSFLISLLTLFLSAPNACYDKCKNQSNYEACLCDCLFEEANDLRNQQQFDQAIDHLKAVDALCPDRNAQAVIDSIYQTHRIWLYKDGAFAVGTPLGEPITDYKYHNPEPFKYGYAIYQNSIGRYFIVDVYGKEISQAEGYDGIIKADGGLLVALSKTYSYDVLNQYNPKGVFKIYLFPKYTDGWEFGKWVEALGLASKYDKAYPYHNPFSDERNIPNVLARKFGDLLVIEEDGKKGVIGKSMQYVIPPQFQRIEALNYSRFFVQKNDKWSLIASNGNILTTQEYDRLNLIAELELDGIRNYKVLDIHDNLLIAELNGKFGLIDSLGCVKAPLKYDVIRNFANKLARIKLEGVWGFINWEGEEIITPQYDEVQPFYKGVGIFRKGTKWGLINTDGEEVIAAKFDELRRLYKLSSYKKSGFRELMEARLGGKWGLINTAGKMVTPLQYDSIYPFKDGLAYLTANGKWGLVDNLGEVLVPTKYQGVKLFSDQSFGLVKYKMDDFWGLIDLAGRERTVAKFNDIKPLGRGIAAVKIGSKWGLMDRQGRELIMPLYDQIQDGGEGMVFLKSGEFWGMVNSQGEIISSPKYSGIKILQSGHAGYKMNGKWGLFHKKGAKILPPIYEELYNTHTHLLKVRSGGLWGLIDTIGTEIATPRYEQVSSLKKVGFKVQLGKKWGILDKNGKEIVPPTYNAIGNVRQSMVPVQLRSQWGLIDTCGQEIIIPKYKYNEIISIHSSFYNMNYQDSLATFLLTHGTYQNNQIGYDMVPKMEGFVFNGSTIGGFQSGNHWGLVNNKGEITVPPKYDGIAYSSQENLVRVRWNGKYGYIDTSGVVRIPTQFNQLGSFRKGLIAFQEEDKWGWLDTSGIVIIPPKYDRVGNFSSGMATFEQNTKWGFVNRIGQEVCLPKYDQIDYFRYGLAAVKVGDKWGFVNRYGQEVIKPSYDKVGRCNVVKGAVTVQWRNKWGLFDSTGMEILPVDYDHIGNGRSGMTKMRKGNKWGFANIHGSIIAPSYDEVKDFHEDLAAFKSDTLWGFIDKVGREVIPAQYHAVKHFVDGVAQVMLAGKWGIVDTAGTTVVPFKYGGMNDYGESRSIVRLDDKWGAIDQYGKEVIPCKHEAMETLIEKEDRGFNNLREFFTGGFIKARVFNERIYSRRVGKWSLIDRHGRSIVDEKYDNIYSFSEGLFQVRHNRKYGLIDTLGQEIIPPILDGIKQIGFGRYQISIDGKIGIFFEANKELIFPEYDDIRDLYKPWVMVQKEGKWGWVDHSGNIKIPCRFDAIAPFDETDKAWVFQFGHSFQINRKGDMIWQPTQKDD